MFLGIWLRGLILQIHSVSLHRQDLIKLRLEACQLGLELCCQPGSLGVCWYDQPFNGGCRVRSQKKTIYYD